MSEKEIITNLNNILKKWQEIINIKDEEEKEIEMNMYFEEMPFYEIQGLLDLYNKEKEKNKELEEKLKSMVDNNSKLVEVTNLYLNSIPKSKVREKIEELNEGLKTTSKAKDFTCKCSQRAILQELLQEGDK